MVKKTDIEKMREIINLYPNIFQITPANTFICILCNKGIDYSRLSSVKSHIDTIMHKSKIKTDISFNNTGPIFISYSKKSEELNYLILETFSSLNIPLSKLRTPQMINLFNYMGYNIKSETSMRRAIDLQYENEINRIINYVKDKYIFLVIDDTKIKNKYYLHILVGQIDIPEKTELFFSEERETPLNSNYVIDKIKFSITFLQIKKENFILLLSDAAPYMILASNKLKTEFIFFHITCIAHLYHNCILKLQSHYININRCIADIQTSINKNKTHIQLFNLSMPPKTIVTR